MNITDEQRRLCAKFEAHLRGGNWMACESASDCLRSGLAHQPATPPDTADGALEWMRLMNKAGWLVRIDNDQLPATRDGVEWHVEIATSYVGADDPLEAFAHALINAAKAWERAK